MFTVDKAIRRCGTTAMQQHNNPYATTTKANFVPKATSSFKYTFGTCLPLRVKKVVVDTASVFIMGGATNANYQNRREQ